MRQCSSQSARNRLSCSFFVGVVHRRVGVVVAGFEVALTLGADDFGHADIVVKTHLHFLAGQPVEPVVLCNVDNCGVTAATGDLEMNRAGLPVERKTNHPLIRSITGDQLHQSNIVHLAQHMLSHPGSPGKVCGGVEADLPLSIWLRSCYVLVVQFVLHSIHVCFSSSIVHAKLSLMH